MAAKDTTTPTRRRRRTKPKMPVGYAIGGVATGTVLTVGVGFIDNKPISLGLAGLLGLGAEVAAAVIPAKHPEARAFAVGLGAPPLGYAVVGGALEAKAMWGDKKALPAPAGDEEEGGWTDTTAADPNPYADPTPTNVYQFGGR